MKIKKDKKEQATEPQEKEEMVCVSSPDGKETICSPGGVVKKVEAQELVEASEKRGNLFIGTLNFFAAPYKGLKGSYERRYSGAKKLFIVDLVLLGVVGLLLGFNIYLFFSRTNIFSFGPAVNEGVIGRKGGTPLSEGASEFSTQIKINGQDLLVVMPGEDLEYAIFYQNSGRKNLYDVSLKVNLEGAVLDFDRLDAERGVQRDNAVVWTKDQVADFAELPPGAKGELKFKIGTITAAPPARVLKFGNSLKSWTETSYKLERDFSEAAHFVGTPREDKINSDLMVSALARYFSSEGDQLGRGPLPPEVGKTTKYWIFWSVENNLNDVSEVLVSASLPPNVSWTGNISVSLGDLSYNSARRALTWKVGDVGRYTGEDWPKQGVAFELALVPTAPEAGTEAALLEQIKIFGNDKSTGQFLEKTVPNLTTNLIYDALASGKEKVVK